jgi:hypothetical protein
MEENTVTTKGRHRSADEWREMVTAWKQSGKTRKVWCYEHGVSQESLRRWTKRLRRMEMNAPLVQIDKRVCAAAQSPLVRLRIVANGDVELVGEFSEEVLRRVLRLARETVHVY